MNNIYTLFNTLLRVSKGLNDLNLNDSTTFFFYILYHDSSNSTVLSLLQILNTLLKKLKIDKWLLLNVYFLLIMIIFVEGFYLTIYLQK